MPAGYRNHRSMTRCPICQRLMPVVGGLIEWHFANTHTRALCKGSATPVPDR